MHVCAVGVYEHACVSTCIYTHVAMYACVCVCMFVHICDWILEN